MSEPFTNPSLDEIRALLRRIHTVAVIGLSPKADRPSHRVAHALQGFGYRVIPVRPAVAEVLGERAYPTLRDVPDAVDVVDVFRAPEHVDDIVDICIERGVPALWLQDGVVNEAAVLRAQRAGILVVMDRCMYRDYKALVQAH